MATAVHERPSHNSSLANPDTFDRSSLRRRLLRWFAVLVIVWTISGIYEGTHLKRGFVPWDAGAYAESAVRVMHGQLPHRDFVEIYTGGLSYMNAVAMRMFGENLAAERIVLFVFFLAWIPALYCIASQFCRNWIAGAVVLLAVAWSVPNYSEAVPSWYNLFFATFGLAALLMYLKRASWKWLFLAGLCGGLSFLAKSVGLCYVAGVLLFFVFYEQSLRGKGSATNESAVEAPRRESRIFAYSVFVFASLLVFLVLLIYMVSPFLAASAGEFVLFVLPSSALCVVLLARELRIQASRNSSARLATLFRMVLPFAVGVIVPILMFLIPYIRAHAMWALINGLFGQAATRIAAAHQTPYDVITIVPAVFLGVALGISARLNKVAGWILTAIVGGLLISGLVLTFSDNNAETAMWSTAYWTIPVLVVIGSILLMRSKGWHANPESAERVFLLLSVTALCSLVEFPFSAPIYFAYVAPLAILSWAAILDSFPRPSRPLLSVVYACFLFLSVFEVTPGFIYYIGYKYLPDEQHSLLTFPRGGNVRTDSQTAAVYVQLIPLIREHAQGSDIYAAPDSPEVYFLAGYRNLTPDIYDFLNPEANRPEKIISVIADPRVRVVVVNKKPPLSASIPTKELLKIDQLFPGSANVGQFEVRWRQ